MWLEGDWLCKRCKFHNYGEEVDCTKCGLWDCGGIDQGRDRRGRERIHVRRGEQNRRSEYSEDREWKNDEYYYWRRRSNIRDEKGGWSDHYGEGSRSLTERRQHFNDYQNRSRKNSHPPEAASFNQTFHSRSRNINIKEKIGSKGSNDVNRRRDWNGNEKHKSRSDLKRDESKIDEIQFEFDGKKVDNKEKIVLKNKLQIKLPEIENDAKNIKKWRAKSIVQPNTQFNHPDTFLIVSVHIELFRSISTQLTQIGCVVSDLGQSSFFQAIKPAGLENYLDNYKLSGDLLKALHMTREDDGSFLFRSQFEVVEEAEKKNILCVKEKEALVGLMNFLEHFPGCLILCVDEDSVAILAEKLKETDNEKLKKLVIGFTHWEKVVNNCDIGGRKTRELEEYHSDKMGHENIPNFMAAAEIAEVLLKSALEIPSKNKVRKFVTDLFYNLSESVECVEASQKIHYDHEDIEVFSSFRPSMTVRFTAKKLEMVTLFSEPDSEPEELVTLKSSEVEGKVCTKKTANDSGLILNSEVSSWDLFGKIYKKPEHAKSYTQASKVWKIGYPTMKGCSVRCPYCTGLFKFPQLIKHLRKNHNNLTPWLQCESCSRPVSPSGLDIHFGRKRGVCVWAQTM